MTPSERLGEPLAAALLPVLLHRIRNTTQLVSGLNALLSLEPDEPPSLPAGRADDLAAAAGEADELGWLLGVLAGGLGADLLMQRCEPRGLATALDLVREALRREGGDLELPEVLPDMTPEVPTHGELCWVASELVWASAGQAEGARLTLEETGGLWTLGMNSPAPEPWGERVAAVRRRLQGAELNGGGGEWQLVLPGTWLVHSV
jgi:hypothetical protein